IVGFGVSVFAGGTRSERYLATKASVESPLAAIARSQASFVFVAARLYRATHSLRSASNEALVGAIVFVVFGVAIDVGFSVFTEGGTRSERYFAAKASADSPLATIALSQASFVLVAPRL